MNRRGFIRTLSSFVGAAVLGLRLSVPSLAREAPAVAIQPNYVNEISEALKRVYTPDSLRKLFESESPFSAFLVEARGE